MTCKTNISKKLISKSHEGAATVLQLTHSVSLSCHFHSINQYRVRNPNVWVSNLVTTVLIDSQDIMA